MVQEIIDSLNNLATEEANIIAFNIEIYNESSPLEREDIKRRIKLYIKYLDKKDIQQKIQKTFLS